LSSKRKTIAYLVRHIDDTVSNQIWEGIISKSKELDVNIISFTGGILGKHESNIIYELCNTDICDGIITWATSETDHLDYFNKFENTPLVSLSLEISGHPCVSIDCYAGMKSALKHLITEHNIKKIAFIQGPETHIYAQERYKAFIDIHKEMGIILDEKRITLPGNWDQATGINGIKLLLDERKLKIPDDIEGLAGANDQIIIGVIDELKKHGIRVPADISVIGFNNTPDAESFTPPITSVAMPYFEQGELAVETIIEMINGKQYERKITLPSTLVLHRSCGCKSAAIQHIDTDLSSIKFEKSIIEKIKSQIKTKNVNKNTDVTFEDIKSETVEKIADRVLQFLGSKCVYSEMLQVLAEKFVDTFIDALEKDNNEVFLNIIEEILVFISEHDCNIEAWHGAISILRDKFMQTNKDIEKYIQAQDLFEQARVVISEVVNRKHIFNNLLNDKMLHAIRTIGSKLITTFNIKNLVKELGIGLKKLEFPGYYLVLYNKQFKYKFPDPIPENVKIILAYNKTDMIDFSEGSLDFPIKNILPDHFLPKNRSYRLTIAPLHFDKSHIGYMILETGPTEKNIYSAIFEQIGSALMGSLLMEERKSTEEFLEKTLDTLHHKAMIVSSNSQQISQRVEDVSSAVEEIAANIRQISNRTEEVMIIVRKAVDQASNANEMIKGLKEKSAKISAITNIINDVAEKTSILALNANIEAAHARESGKGFKIVALEVKKLSTLTMKSTEEIKEVVESIQNGSSESYEAIKNAVNVINKVSDLTDAIKEAVSQQVLATNDVSNKLIQTAYGSKEIFEAIKEVAFSEEENDADSDNSSITGQIKNLKKKSD